MPRRKPRLDVAQLAHGLYHQRTVEHLSSAALKERALQFAQVTEFGSINFSTDVREPSARRTVYVGSERVLQRTVSRRQQWIRNRAAETLVTVHRYLDRSRLVCIERTMGDNPAFCPHCTMYVTTYDKAAVQIPYMWGETLFPYRPTAPGPDLTWIGVPEWPRGERQVLVFPEEGVTYVLGSDCMGEARDGFLRMAMWYAKQEGMLGVRAGAQIVQARQPDGRLRRCSTLLFGLSAGESSHACDDHGLCRDGESVEVVQDDVCFLRRDGSALGAERGFYLKTKGIAAHDRPLLYRAATRPDTIFENVMVEADGNVDFQDETLTSSGRAVVRMANLAPRAADSIGLPPADETDGMLLFFIIRRDPALPVLARLTPEQTALAFMLGESAESPAGGNPLMVGDAAAEGNWVYEFARGQPKVEGYLINAGGVGEADGAGARPVNRARRVGGTRIKRDATSLSALEMSALFRAVARRGVRWAREPYFGLEAPEEIEGVDLGRFDPGAHYSRQEIEERVQDVKRERRARLERYPGLDPAIIAAA